ncbi:MAG: GGDEF domain-containing protein, partial [Proteobacteria bacterium]|nr:GGDEF domain-containing protein [Pseudomonadota bacterium]MBU1454971.1 GGDEF domain-containing protein [Pseudomonadota bacterium]
HDIGDKVLKNLAAESLGVLRDSDIFGRWGGEEFIAFLPETNIHESSMIAERLRSKLSRIEVSDRKGRLVTITVSIGLRVVTSGETDVLVDEVIREADDALYMAKKEGRNRVVLL